jgi:hypothetical protein
MQVSKEIIEKRISELQGQLVQLESAKNETIGAIKEYQIMLEFLNKPEPEDNVKE